MIHEDDAETERWSFVLVIAVAAGITLPLLGAVGFFDPWETNYAEVARQMAVRDDYLYPYWKDSYFFSKPILLFWLTAPFYKLIGADDPNGPIPAAAELFGRLPSALAAILCVAITYAAARRLWGRRAAVYSGIALATMPLWAFMSRQAITDMLYVGPASAALLLLAIALFDDDTDKTARIPRWMLVAFGVCIVPQLWEIGRTGAFLDRITIAGSELVPRVAFSVVTIGLAIGFLIYLAKKGRDPLLHAAAALFALSLLAKGPPGVVICGGVLLITIALRNEWHLLARPAAITSTILFLLIGGPWFIVMAVFKGLDDGRKTWVQRFILYDLLGRVGPGAHGDRGTFEYYLRYAGFGMFPWSALVPAAFFSAAENKEGSLKSARFTLLCAVWLVVTLVFFAATTTKFHHYIFPLCVPSALLIGRYMDSLVTDPTKKLTPIIALFSVIFAALIARDLVMEPWQLVDLFTYHYKSYKPEYYFPPDPEWRIGLSVAGFGAAVIMGLGALLDLVPSDTKSAIVAGFGFRPVGRGLAPRRWLATIVSGTTASAFVVSCLIAGIAFALFVVQVHFNRASQHWSQRWLIETYYDMKKGDEPLISYQMDWKGETFYAKNADIQIKKSGAELKKAVERKGREFVLVQTDRFGGLKNSLGKEYESKIRVVDRSNQKWYLVLIDD
jgi:4-amino-4-deoxy-L-arabinose transferase-like glycosyltransferase